jgi:hypothetical protein
LALLFFVSFFNYLDRMVIAVMVEPMKRDLAMSDTQVGLVSGFAFAVLYALCGLPLARVADRGPRKWLLALCLAGWSGMTALTGMVRTFGELFAARMAVGVGEAGCVPAAHSMIRGNGVAGWPGWPTIPALETLRDAWFDAPTLEEQKRIAMEIQRVALDEVSYIPLGSYYGKTALRKNLTGRVPGLMLSWNLRRV